MEVERELDNRSFVLVGETAGGMFVRAIPKALPLLAGLPPGTAAEVATRSAVVRWGMPDFVFRQIVRAKGKAGRRELGDGLLLQGQRGVIVQVKHRSGGTGRTDREQSWVTKSVRRAILQANGTARSLSAPGIAITNARGRPVALDPATEWLAAVIIDHDDAPPISPDTSAAKLPVVVLLRRDWEFLFDQLRSTYAVIQYLHRVAQDSSIALGDEPVRYYELADADEAAPPGPVDPAVLGRGNLGSWPLLPKAPAGHEDTDAHAFLQDIMDDIAVLPIPVPEEERLKVLVGLDRLPINERTVLGRHLQALLDVATEIGPGGTEGNFRVYRFGRNDPQLIFGVFPAYSDEIREWFGCYVRLRHHEYGEDIENATVLTVGVLLTPRRDGATVPWDTTLVALHGDQRLAPEDLVELRRVFTSGRMNQ